MKKSILFFLVCLLAAGFAGQAQMPTALQIKNLKIKKIVRQEKHENNTGTTEWLYNDHGDETAMYINGKRYAYKTIVYDASNRIASITEFSDEGKERYKTMYTYNADGSYKTENKDATYGLVNTEKFDSKGLIISRIIPDGSVYHYEYNNKGLLTRLYSEPKNQGIKFSNSYTYNPQGKLIKQVNSGDFPSVSVYTYDSKGLLKTTTITEGPAGTETEKTVYEYKYVY